MLHTQLLTNSLSYRRSFHRSLIQPSETHIPLDFMNPAFSNPAFKEHQIILNCIFSFMVKIHCGYKKHFVEPSILLKTRMYFLNRS